MDVSDWFAGLWLRLCSIGEAGEQVSVEEAQRKRLASGLEAAQKSLAEALDKLKTEEKRSASYEKLLKESKGNMVSIIEKMQSIVNKVRNEYCDIY